MKDKLLQWWPIAPTLVILYLGGVAFLEKYPRASTRRSNYAVGTRTPDSLLAYFRSGVALPDTGSAVPDPTENPFRPIHQPHPAGQTANASRLEPPPRRYVLRGTVGNNVATITNGAGQKQILKVGDRIDSAEVVSIEANKVVLKDRGGRFELLNQK
ncbi:MAG: hypothetical protein ABIW76_10815 [Fibrobacteria bacterium]